MSRAEQASAFCSVLFGGLGDDDRLAGLYATLWDSADKLTRWRRADQPGAVASLIAELDEHPNAEAVYIGVGLAAEPRHNRTHRECDDGTVVTDQRPRREDVVGLFGLWADIDIAGEGHADAHYPPTVEAARRVVDAMGLKPTLVLHSGGGLQVWWMFAEPWLVRDAADPVAEHARMTKLATDWLRTVQYRADVVGRFKIDSVFDLARLLRPAGTTNRKIAGNPRKVEILEHDPGAVYEAEDFEAHLPEPAVLTAYANPVNTITGVALSEAEAAMVREVNFAALWTRVNSVAYRTADYTPPWLVDILELEAEADGGKPGDIARVWNHNRPDLKDDENRYDAALVKLLAEFEAVDTEGLIEAIMCRRLRLPDSAKADKVDPRKRLDYITRTVAKFRAKAEDQAQLNTQVTDAIDAMASVALSLPSPATPNLEVETDRRGRVVDQVQADAAFGGFTAELVDMLPPSEGEAARAADDVVVAEHAGDAPARPVAPEVETDEGDPFGVYGKRSDVEIQALDTLTDLLIPPAYRARGIRVQAIEYRDYGEQQRARLLLRLPIDFDWPADRPSRYRPGRPLPTEWWNRNLFDSSRGFQMALERDCKIIARVDAPKTEWTALIRRLVPLWRRDSSGSDVAHFAREWLFGYLMLHHGTGQLAEVGASGRPWVRKTNGWRPERPPSILLDRNEFMEHCRRQPGAVQGRAVAGVMDYLKLTRRRIRADVPGMSGRPTWYEIDAEQFTAGEWGAIIEVTRISYERSMTGKSLRVVGSEERGYGIDGSGRAAR